MKTKANQTNVSFTIYRRHSGWCKYVPQGRRQFGCTCPIWGDGYLDGDRILRKSLNTRDAAKANARMARLLQVCSLTREQASDTTGPENWNLAANITPKLLVKSHPVRIATSTEECESAVVKNAVGAYLANCKTNGIKTSTFRKYRNALQRLAEFAIANEVRLVRDINVTHLDQFRAERKIAPITSLKELEMIRQFWSYCVARDLCKQNIAQRIKGPSNISPNEVEPYSIAEIERILAATQEFGRGAYERKRSKAIMMTLRYTALRIGDVAVLRRDRITRKNGQWLIFLHATKNNKPVFLPIPLQMKEALDAVPTPRGAKKECPYYFWSGDSEQRTIVSTVGECVRAVFRKSGVQKAHAHRFRHTLATELLGAGGSFEEVADILGDSVEIVIKHYAKWSSARQARVTDLMTRVHGDLHLLDDRSNNE
jgi:site-specific recombinase XerD